MTLNSDIFVYLLPYGVVPNDVSIEEIWLLKSPTTIRLMLICVFNYISRMFYEIGYTMLGYILG